MTTGGYAGRHAAPLAVLLLAALVLVIAGCSSGAAPTPPPTGAAAGASAAIGAPTAGVATATARPTLRPTATPRPTPFPAAGVKWLKAYCPAAKQFVGIVTMYQGIQGDMASLNFGDIQPRVTKMLASVMTLETLVKKIPNWGPGAAAATSLTTAVTKLHMASDMFQKAWNGNLPDLGAMAAAAQTGVAGIAAGADATSAMAQLAVLTGKDCTGIVPGI